MSYKVKNNVSLLTIAVALVLMGGANTFAVEPLTGQNNDGSAASASPAGLSVADTASDDALLAPPLLTDTSSSASDDVLIPLTSNNENSQNEIQDLNLPNLNGENAEPASNALPEATNQAEPLVSPSTNANNTDATGGLSASTAPLAAPQTETATVQPMKFFKPQATSPESSNFGENLLSQVDNDLFNQMSDLEKQTSLLTLELRREKVKNEIAAIKAARQKAIDDLAAQKEEKERKKAEWEAEQQRKLLIEEQKLRELNIEYEKLRQENIINAYKEQMLETSQKWIDNNEKMYAEIMKMEDERDKLVNNYKLKLNYLTQLSAKAAEAAEIAKNNYSRELANMQTQISILKSRLDAEKQARVQVNAKPGDKTNPFASLGSAEDEEAKKNQKLSDEYAIMEIKGKGDSLAAKLINKGGSTFMVKKGTVLQSGHTVEEITQTYLKADKDGNKDYLYFAAGGVLDREPIKTVLPSFLPRYSDKSDKSDDTKALPALSATKTLPSLRKGMFIR